MYKYKYTNITHANTNIYKYIKYKNIKHEIQKYLN